MDDIAADCVLVNGHIVTLDPARPRATALAIVSDRIVAVAGDREIRRLRDRRTRVVDLRGATVVPGLVDAHAHLDREGLKYREPGDRKSTRLNSSHSQISYAVFCLKKKRTKRYQSCRSPAHGDRRATRTPRSGEYA